MKHWIEFVQRESDGYWIWYAQVGKFCDKNAEHDMSSKDKLGYQIAFAEECGYQIEIFHVKEGDFIEYGWELHKNYNLVAEYTERYKTVYGYLR